MPSRQQMPASLGTLWILFSGKSFNLFVIFCFVLWHTALSFFLADKLIQWSDSKSHTYVRKFMKLWSPTDIFHVPTVELQEIFVCFFIGLQHSHNFGCQLHVPLVKIYFHCKPVLWVNFFQRRPIRRGVLWQKFKKELQVGTSSHIENIFTLAHDNIKKEIEHITFWPCPHHQHHMPHHYQHIHDHLQHLHPYHQGSSGFWGKGWL